MNRLTIEQERDALYNAARRVGLDARITYMERKGDAHTYAEKLMLNSDRKGMPYKSSYLYCDALDTCFFFDHDGLLAQWGQRPGQAHQGGPDAHSEHA